MSTDAPSSSTLPAAALAASRAALNSALADPASNSAPLTIVTATDGDVQAPLQDATPLTGQPQDVDAPMPQFDQVRTVFSDPNNFNVKVRSFVLSRAPCSTHRCRRSTRSTRHGPSGSTRPPQRAAISPRRRRPRARRRRLRPPRPAATAAAGWTTLKRLSASIA